MAAQDVYKDFQNDEFTVATAGTEVEIIFDYETAIGTDATNTRYMSFRKNNAAKRIVIRCDQAFSITEINGKVLKSGVSITANSSWTIKDNVRIDKFKILTGTDAADVKIFAVV